MTSIKRQQSRENNYPAGYKTRDLHWKQQVVISRLNPNCDQVKTGPTCEIFYFFLWAPNQFFSCVRSTCVKKMPFKDFNSIEFWSFLLRHSLLFCLPVNDHQRSALMNESHSKKKIRSWKKKMTMTQFRGNHTRIGFEGNRVFFLQKLIDWLIGIGCD